MKPVRSLSFALALSAPLLAQGRELPSLSVELLPNVVQFHVADDAPFAAAVLISLRPDLVHYFVGLPPLLGDAAVLGSGFATADAGMRLKVAEAAFPPGIELHVQAVTLGEAGIRSSGVESFVLDVTVPEQR